MSYSYDPEFRVASMEPLDNIVHSDV
jgi:hypothetical protein